MARQDASTTLQRSATGGSFAYHGSTYRPFVAARYHWPRGQFYHRYRAGMHMQSFFWLTDYVIVDYSDYELAAPSAACEWVRYGPDLLLINLSTGEVVDVVYGAFVEAPPDDPIPADGAATPNQPHS